MAMAKINISIPDGLLDEVDEMAAQLNRSRSGFVAEATAHYVAAMRDELARAERRERIDQAVAQAQNLGSKFGSFDAGASVRQDRDGDKRTSGHKSDKKGGRR